MLNLYIIVHLPGEHCFRFYNPLLSFIVNSVYGLKIIEKQPFFMFYYLHLTFPICLQWMICYRHISTRLCSFSWQFQQRVL
ncbi:hypothetical protein GDO78_005982 [Eleutherodactylus coqui]|uniref:Uncharacterized protein n=1 Tax=Eleutherodactylus coqui TaxID=57060 RepID=A0A8J6FM68_ELECQ|nr:hypothetical protein GDO78_005982 [Eleutherodactylus coqui]